MMTIILHNPSTVLEFKPNFNERLFMKQYRNITLILLTMMVLPIAIGCSCIEIEDPAVFEPTDYSNFVTLAFSTFWEVTKDNVTLAEYPNTWINFNDASKKLALHGIDLEVQFINRMLKNDNLWSKYEGDRAVYESTNLGETYKDQIIAFISNSEK